MIANPLNLQEILNNEVPKNQKFFKYADKEFPSWHMFMACHSRILRIHDKPLSDIFFLVLNYAVEADEMRLLHLILSCFCFELGIANGFLHLPYLSPRERLYSSNGSSKNKRMDVMGA